MLILLRVKVRQIAFRLRLWMGDGSALMPPIQIVGADEYDAIHPNDQRIGKNKRNAR